MKLSLEDRYKPSLMNMALSATIHYAFDGDKVWIVSLRGGREIGVCIEDEDGDIELPPVGWQLQLHHQNDGFAAPVYVVRIDSRIKYLTGDKP